MAAGTITDEQKMLCSPGVKRVERRKTKFGDYLFGYNEQGKVVCGEFHYPDGGVAVIYPGQLDYYETATYGE